MPPKISVVLCVYNGSDFIFNSIKSILDQSFHDFELIVVDDASNDSTQSILGNIDDPRIILVRNEVNIGLTKSINKAINFARGQYIARQDADDESMPDRLEKQYHYMEANPSIGLLGTFAEFFDDAKSIIGNWVMPVTNLDINNALPAGNVFCHGSVMIRRSVLEKSGLYREKFRFTQDYELWLRIAEHAQLANLDQFLYKMYRGKNTISRTKLEQQLAYQVVAYELSKERVELGYDSYETLLGDDPYKWIEDIYPSSMPYLYKLMENNYLYYIKEAIKYNDFSGAINLHFKLNSVQSAGYPIIKNAKSFFLVSLIYFRYYFNVYLGWRF